MIGHQDLRHLADELGAGTASARLVWLQAAATTRRAGASRARA
jgi:hypothetical protein